MPATDPTNINASPYGSNNPKRIDVDQIEKLVLSDYGLTPSAIKAYMFGIRVIDENTGEEMPDDFYWQILSTQVSEVQHMLDIQILPMSVQNELHDYYENEAYAYNRVDTFKRPILQLDSFKLKFGNQPLIDFDPQWWKIYNIEGEIEVYPLNYARIGSGPMGGGTPTISGLTQLYMSNYVSYPMYRNQTSAPQAYSIDYVAGMLPPKRVGVTQDWEMPADLQQLILYKCLNQVFMQWGRLLGVGAGISSKELSIDGIRQNIVTTQSAMYTGSRADIDVINDEIKGLTASLKSFYGNSYTSV